MTDTAVLMPRRATGSIESHTHRDGRTTSFYVRVRFEGTRYRLTLGTSKKGWSRERAQVELDGILDRIERGTWTPPAVVVAAPRDVETFHMAASRWWLRREVELAANTRLDYRWRLDHLLRQPDLVRASVASVDVQAVDDVRARLISRGLGPRSVNMCLDLLAQILDDAVDAKLLAANPARGKRRRMKVKTARRSFLEPDMVVDMLDVAGEWEHDLPEHQRYGRRALLSVLVLGGTRISEALNADRGALDLHGGRLRVGDSKTEAGLRDVELSEFLLSEVRGHVVHADGPGPIFRSRTGKPLNPSNVRNRLLAEVVTRANKRRGIDGRMLLPARVTPHTLRRTFASLALAAGRDPRWVMAQLGHTDARLTLNVYAQVMQRQRVDEALIRSLMAFPSEAFDPTSDPTTVEAES